MGDAAASADDVAAEGRLAAAIAAIDAANADDPERLVVDGVARPKEQAHAEAMTAWVRRLDPDADDAQLVAARAHHLRRWVVPRRDYPEGRAGYLRWRADQKRRHAAEVGELLAEVGYPEAFAARVGAIIRKEGLGTDPAVQVHEDALCLVFLQTQAEAVADDLGVDRTVAVLAKTATKMSERGLAEAQALDLPVAVRRLLEQALADEATTPGDEPGSAAP